MKLGRELMGYLEEAGEVNGNGHYQKIHCIHSWNSQRIKSTKTTFKTYEQKIQQTEKTSDFKKY